jgi:uncharacterized protein (TIGR00251 family)
MRTGKAKFNISKGKEWVVDVKSRAEHGKANSELVRELSKRYGRARIVKGFKSRRKVVEVG